MGLSRHPRPRQTWQAVKYETLVKLLQNADAVLFNCSLLTSDVYVLAYHSWWCGEPVHWVFYIGFCITLAACGLYNVTE